MTILIIVENQLEQLKICLESIHLFGNTDHKDVLLQTVVIDNASTDDTLQWLEQRDVAYATEEKRQNYGCILNEAMEAFGIQDDLFIWNPCYAMTPSFLSTIMKYFEEESGVGIAGPASNGFAVSENDSDLSGDYEQVMQCVAHGRKKESRIVEKLDYPVLCIKKEVLTELGGFCESSRSDQMAMEEYQVRAMEAGYKLGYCAQAVAYRFCLHRMKNEGLLGNVLLLKSGNPIIQYSFQQVGQAYRRLGYHVEEFAASDLPEKTYELRSLLVKGIKRAFIFNNCGITINDQDQKNIWDKYHTICVDFLFDHPVFSSHVLPDIPQHGVATCVDRRHLSYLKKYYPDINCYFLPLAGQDITYNGRKKPWRERRLDILYVGGYSKEKDMNWYPFEEVLLKELMTDNNKTFDDVIRKFAHDNNVDENDTMYMLQGAGRVEWYLKLWIRKEVLRHLVMGGITVEVCGVDWENSDLIKYPNLHLHGNVSQRECLELMQDSKIVLNVMPNFKDGIHDRVINAMLAGAVALTDESGYLSEKFERGKDYISYSTQHLEDLPDIVRGILENPEKAEQMTAEVYEKAAREHTWDFRIRQLEELLS